MLASKGSRLVEAIRPVARVHPAAAKILEAMLSFKSVSGEQLRFKADIKEAMLVSYLGASFPMEVKKHCKERGIPGNS